jgi:RNA 3'-terminal phosphate cyclase
MPDDMKPYVIVRVVGQEAFEAEVCRLMKSGYEPAGGRTMMQVVRPITQQSAVGFFQALSLPAVFRREGMRVVRVVPSANPA